MKVRPSNTFALLSVMLLLYLLIYTQRPVVEADQRTATIEIINPLSVDGNFVFNATDYPINTTFSADFYIVNVTGMFAWQIYASWNNTVINYQKAWIPENNVYAQAIENGATVITPQPYVEVDQGMGFLLYGAALLPHVPVDVNGMGLLFEMNFTIAEEPQDSQIFTNIELISQTPGSLSLDTYVILASGVPVPVYAQPAMVRIQKEQIQIVQDLGVASVVAQPSTAEVGDIIKITITLQNLGNDLETANVTLKNGEELISQFAQTLGANQTVDFEYDWNTTSVSPGTYEVTVDIAKLPSEINVDNNHVETMIVVKEKLVGLDYVRWLIVLWATSPLGIFAIVYVSILLGLLTLYWTSQARARKRIRLPKTGFSQCPESKSRLILNTREWLFHFRRCGSRIR